jgi:hypothetical protein
MFNWWNVGEVEHITALEILDTLLNPLLFDSHLIDGQSGRELVLGHNSYLECLSTCVTFLSRTEISHHEAAVVLCTLQRIFYLVKLMLCLVWLLSNSAECDLAIM